MASPIPASVSRRKRLVLAGDIFLGLAIVAAALHFFTLSLSNLLWPIAGIAATIYTTSLRQSIRHLDAPTTEMDEYELRLHTDARDTGLKTAVVISIVPSSSPSPPHSACAFSGRSRLQWRRRPRGLVSPSSLPSSSIPNCCGSLLR